MLMMFNVVFLRRTKVTIVLSFEGRNTSTLNAAEYGIPIGKLAKTASALLALTPLNARLCVISWIDKKRLWLAVPPMT